ncbi:hypothetical protein DITRI_Ditri06bG0017300 [Diplodiscus trichospermus]
MSTPTHPMMDWGFCWEMAVELVFGPMNGSQVWKLEIGLRRKLFDWEICQWEEFHSLINGYYVNGHWEDRLIWKGSVSSRYSTSAFCKDHSKFSYQNLLNWKFVWAGLAPPKVEMFCWQVLRGRIAVKEQLVLRKVLPSRRALSWTKPHVGTMKFNVDGSTMGKPGPAGIGGVLRDHLANAKIIFFKSVGIADSNLAELLAILGWITNPTFAPWRIRNFISHIETLKQQVPNWSILHILRESNEVADWLGKTGVNRGNDFLVVNE